MKQTVFFGLILLLGLSACTAQPTPAPRIAPTVIPDPFRPTAPEAVRDELFDQVGFFLTNPVFRDSLSSSGAVVSTLGLPLISSGKVERHQSGEITLYLVDAYVLSKDQNAYRIWVAVGAEKGAEAYFPILNPDASAEDRLTWLQTTFYRGRIFSLYAPPSMASPNQVNFNGAPEDFPAWYRDLAIEQQEKHQSYLKRLLTWSLQEVPSDWILAGWMVSLYSDDKSLTLSGETSE